MNTHLDVGDPNVRLDKYSGGSLRKLALAYCTDEPPCMVASHTTYVVPHCSSRYSYFPQQPVTFRAAYVHFLLVHIFADLTGTSIALSRRDRLDRISDAVCQWGVITASLPAFHAPSHTSCPRGRLPVPRDSCTSFPGESSPVTVAMY